MSRFSRPALLVGLACSAGCSIELDHPLLPPQQVQVVAGQARIEVWWEVPPEPEAVTIRLLYSSSGDPLQAGRSVDAVTSPLALTSAIVPGATYGVRVEVLGGAALEVSPLLQVRPLPLGLFSTAATWTLPGGSAGGQFGATVVFAGDLNADGIGDVLVGAPAETFGGLPGSGATHLVLGGSPPAVDTKWKVGGTSTGAGSGSAVAGNGADPNGYADVALGAPDTSCTGSSSACGAVAFVRGGIKGPFLPPLLLTTGLAGSHSGSSLSFGDVNGDGLIDLLVLSAGSGALPGEAQLFPGSGYGLPAAPIWTVPESAGNGARGVIADLDDDGNGEICLAQPLAGVTGSLLLYAGGQMPSTTAQSLPVLPGDLHFGVGLAAVGDVNGDGKQDLMAATVSSSGGAVWLVLGGSTNGNGSLARRSGWSYPIRSLGDTGLSSILARAGDVDGDGLGDVLVGDPHAASDQGAAYLFLGTPSGLAAAPAWVGRGPGPGARFGTAVAAGDVDGDGLIDLVVGAPGLAPGGAVLIFKGLPQTGLVVWGGPPSLSQAGQPFTPGQAGFVDPYGGTGAYFCSWDWGDGSLGDGVSCSASASPTISHTYSSPGRYFLRLCVTAAQESTCPGGSVFGEAVTTVYVH